MEYLKLANGYELPIIGYGTSSYPEGEMRRCLKEAIKAGYRHFDTAQAYVNEIEIGDVLEKSELKREEYYITTKFFPISPNVSEAFLDLTIQRQLKRLKVDYIDLYLLHFPVGQGANIALWKVLEKYYEKGVFKSIGISNYWRNHMRDLLKGAKVKPHVNQLHISPLYNPIKTIRFAEDNDIKLTAYSMFQNNEVNNKAITDIAQKHNKTPGQIVLRWGVQKNFLLIPKSSTSSRIISNIDVFNFSLTDDEVKILDDQNQSKFQYWNPETTILGGRTW